MTSVLHFRAARGMLTMGLKSLLGGQPPARFRDAAIFAPGFRPVRSPMAGVRRYKAGNGTNNPARPSRVLSPRCQGWPQKLPSVASFNDHLEAGR